MINRYMFRGKRIDTGEWVQGWLLFHDIIREHNAGLSVGTTDMSTECEFRCNAIRVDKLSIGQCTGLKDINGVLIFDGDIFEWACSENDDKTFGPVKYGAMGNYYDDNNNADGFIIDWEKDFALRKELGFWCSRLEIIGNIHDKNLLKEDNA